MRRKALSNDKRENYRHRVWRAAIFKRDDDTCQKCGRSELVGRKRHAHHLKPWKEFPELRYELSNGQTLCRDCHMEETSRERKLAKAA